MGTGIVCIGSRVAVISFRNMWHVGEKHIAACEYLSRFSVFKPPKLLIPKKGLQARCRPRETALKNLGKLRESRPLSGRLPYFRGYMFWNQMIQSANLRLLFLSSISDKSQGKSSKQRRARCRFRNGGGDGIGREIARIGYRQNAGFGIVESVFLLGGRPDNGIAVPFALPDVNVVKGVYSSRIEQYFDARGQAGIRPHCRAVSGQRLLAVHDEIVECKLLQRNIGQAAVESNFILDVVIFIEEAQTVYAVCGLRTEIDLLGGRKIIGGYRICGIDELTRALVVVSVEELKPAAAVEGNIGER